MTEVSDDQIISEIEVRSSYGKLANEHEVHYQKAYIKRGKRRWRSAILGRVVDPESGEIKDTTLTLESWDIHRRQPTNLVTPTKDRWRCENDEIWLLKEFLDSNILDGTYRVTASDATLHDLIESFSGDLDPEAIQSILEQVSNKPALATALAKSNIATAVLQNAEIQRRKSHLEHLRTLIDTPGITEHELHASLKQHVWMFGGQYIREDLRRQLTTQSTLDIPLTRGDGSLHVIELKRADIGSVVEQNRQAGLTPGVEIHRGVSQLQNYLRDLDECRDSILARHNVDCRRSSATLLIGNSSLCPSASQEQIAETFRVYNSHQTRIQVLTYDELINNAERALEFGPAELRHAGRSR